MSHSPPPNPNKIKKLHIRHYPPGFQIEYHSNEKVSIQIPRDILAYLSIDTIASSAEKIIQNQPILQSRSKTKQEKLTNLVVKCLTSILNTRQNHVNNIERRKFKSSKVLKAHVLPLTNVAFNKSGSLFLTGSYDRTAKIWSVASLLGNQMETEHGLSAFASESIGQSNNAEPITLEGHKNVVYTLAFNNPFGNKVATGSFDRTAKIWETTTGKCLQTLRGHSGEVVCLGFNSNSDPESQLLATGSMDGRCGIWKVGNSGNSETTNLAQQLQATRINSRPNSGVSNLSVQSVPEEQNEPNLWLAGHSADLIALNWEPHENGTKLITGSFDRTAAIWDVMAANSSNPAPLFTLIGHREEISSVYLDYSGSLAITGSMDKTARIWDVRAADILKIGF